MDEYIVKKCMNGKGAYFYYKNGKLHREAGPAIIFPKTTNNDLGDHELYKEEIVSTLNPFGYYAQRVKENPTVLYDQPTVARYYLEGQPYSKIDFEKIKIKLQLEKELDNNLSKNNSSIKKLKV